MISPGSLKCLKLCTDVEIQKYKGRGENREGGGRRTDFAWQKGCSLFSAPFPSHCPPPHCHTCSHVHCLPGNAADIAPGTCFASSKRRKQAVYATWKIHLLWGSQAYHKSFPASPETCGWQEAPGEQLPALDRTGHGAHFIRNHAASISTPCQQHESCSLG